MKAEWSNKDSLEMPTTTSGDYIKREDAIAEAKKWSMFGKDDLVSRLERLPSADMVEVVRCKDCKYWRPDTRPNGNYDERPDGLWGYGNLCVKHLPNDQLEAIEFSPDDYCKYGERKEK